MLILFALFVDQSNDKNNHSIKSSQEAMAVFAFFLFIVYSFFGGLLATYRNEITKTEDDTETVNFSDSSFNHQNFHGNNYENVNNQNVSFDTTNDFDDHHI